MVFWVLGKYIEREREFAIRSSFKHQGSRTLSPGLFLDVRNWQLAKALCPLHVYLGKDGLCLFQGLGGWLVKYHEVINQDLF